MVLADSYGLSQIPHYLGTPPGGRSISCTGPLPSAARLSRALPLSIDLMTPRSVCRHSWQVPRPRCSIAGRLYHCNGLGSIPFRSPLLRESLLLSFPRGTEMFQFPRFPPPALCVQAGVTGHDPSRVSPFGYPRIKAWSTAPRGFSQPPTSFIGIWRQGIHRWLFIAWEFTCTVSFKDARARSAVLKGRVRSCAPTELG